MTVKGPFFMRSLQAYADFFKSTSSSISKNISIPGKSEDWVDLLFSLFVDNCVSLEHFSDNCRQFC